MRLPSIVNRRFVASVDKINGNGVPIRLGIIVYLTICHNIDVYLFVTDACTCN